VPSGQGDQINGVHCGFLKVCPCDRLV